VTGETHPACECKVGRQAKTYGLPDLDEELRARYLEQDDSLRSLADHVNARIVGSRLDRTDANVVGDTVSVYEALVGDDVPPERRADITDQLEYAGIDLDSLQADFVSHQTVKTHLNDCLNVDTSRTGVDSLADGRRIIEWSRERDEHVIEQTLGQLRRADLIHSGRLKVTQTVTVRCTDCDETFRINELLEETSCQCHGEC
jgi:hypothetical protein